MMTAPVPLEICENDEHYGDDDEEQEEVGLLRRAATNPSHDRRYAANNHTTQKLTKMPLLYKVLLPVLFLVIVIVGHKKSRHLDPDVIPKNESSVQPEDEESQTCQKDLQAPMILSSADEDPSGILNFACPCDSLGKSCGDLRCTSNAPKMSDNVTAFLKVFRDMEFDDWGHTFSEVKSGLYEWKKTYFSQYLEHNSTIYESGCGEGLNLYMTLEILHEVEGLKNLVVYGNDFREDSVRLANEIANKGSLPADAQLGSICPGDSTNLRHVPSDSFDLVFTAYIPPLLDPLGLAKNSETEFDALGMYSAMCEELQNEDSVHRKREAQHLQDRWFAHWFGEMIRIAKPGAPVVAEQVSSPICEARFDWGGVSQDFWKMAAKNHGWDVDLESIVFEESRLVFGRYNVFMKKNK